MFLPVERIQISEECASGRGNKEMENQDDLHYSPTHVDHPSLRKVPGGWRSIRYILANEAFEKLASMSLVANIAVYLRAMYHLDGIYLVNVINIFSGSSNITPIAGAIVSDAFLGRFLTLLLGSISSFLGMVMVTLTAGLRELRPPPCEPKKPEPECPSPKTWQLLFLFASLGMMVIGAGGIRPCNIAFGADQFDTSTAKGRQQLESFFNWWYFSFTIALVLALTVVVYIQTNISWLVGFAVPSACLFISISVFLIGRRTYVCKKPQGSIFSDMAKVINAAIKKRNLKTKLGPDGEISFYDPVLPGTEAARLSHTERFGFLDKAAVVVDPERELDEAGRARDEWRLCGLQQVEQLKCLVRILPVWVSGIACFMTMEQQNSFGILQAIQMDKKIGRSFEIPPGWMGLTSMIALSVWVYIYECVYLKVSLTKDKRLTMEMRIQIGIWLAILCMAASGLVERYRREDALRIAAFESSMSVLWLLPQFALAGLVEAFAAVAIMELLTMQMPESMRTVAGAIFFLSLSISSYVNSIIVNTVHSFSNDLGKAWIGGPDLNQNRLENYYYVIMGLDVLNIIYFYCFAKRFIVVETRGSCDGDIVSEDKSCEV